MALDFLLGKVDPLVVHDTYFPSSGSSNACRVKIECPGKGRIIYAMLSEGFSIAAKSKWTSLFSGAIGGDIGSKILDVVDNVAQMTWGYTIRQPYFGRKYWQGTEPLKFSLTFQFVSFSDAKFEVYLPMVDLLSLLFPRLDSAGGSAGLFQKYFIPGPNLFYNTKTGDSEDDGDRVEISMGNFMRFKGCYIHSINLKVENSFSTDGYPNCVQAVMEFETMDVAYVGADNSFMENGFGDASVDLGEGLATLKNMTKKVLEGASEVINGVVDAGGELLSFLR